jgi:hypothetical protein
LNHHCRFACTKASGFDNRCGGAVKKLIPEIARRRIGKLKDRTKTAQSFDAAFTSSLQPFPYCRAKGFIDFRLYGHGNQATTIAEKRKDMALAIPPASGHRHLVFR